MYKLSEGITSGSWIYDRYLDNVDMLTAALDTSILLCVCTYLCRVDSRRRITDRPVTMAPRALTGLPGLPSSDAETLGILGRAACHDGSMRHGRTEAYIPGRFWVLMSLFLMHRRLMYRSVCVETREGRVGRVGYIIYFRGKV